MCTAQKWYKNFIFTNYITVTCYNILLFHSDIKLMNDFINYIWIIQTATQFYIYTWRSLHVSKSRRFKNLFLFYVRPREKKKSI